jgi:subtilase family serine protease
VGRNDAYTWWYIAYPGASGGHAWIAGSVVTSACVPSVVQVVAAPPLPTAVPTEVVASSDDNDNDLFVIPDLNLPPMQLHIVDLALVGMQLSSDPATQGVAINVKITVENKGTVDVGSFNVLWWSAGPTVGCSWTVPSLAAGAKKALTCTYTYGGWNNAYQIKAMVDPEHAVAESNEGNNIVQRTLQVKDATP